MIDGTTTERRRRRIEVRKVTGSDTFLSLGSSQNKKRIQFISKYISRGNSQVYDF